MAEMTLTADHLIVIHRGRLLADTGTSEFIERHARTFVRVRAQQPEQLHRELVSAGMTVAVGPDGSLEINGTRAAEISRLAAVKNLTLHELSTQEASLEEAFLRLTNSDNGGAR
jgi:ABC-2 type transport system ATP-binding protein